MGIFDNIGENFFGGEGTDASKLSSGTITTGTPEQQALLRLMIQRFLSGASDINTISPDAYSLNNKDFIEGTVNPILREVEQQAVDIGNRYAGQRTGTGRSRATTRVVEQGQTQISEALARAALEADRNKIEAERNALTAEQLNQSNLSLLLGTNLYSPYALALGGESRSAGIGREHIRSGQKGAENFWGGGGSSAFSGIFGSDVRFKKSITVLGNINGIIIAKWIWRVTGNIGLGFIAQNVIKTLPNAVINMGGYLFVNYPAVIKYLLSFR
jgi:hypothetical protein